MTKSESRIDIGAFQFDLANRVLLGADRQPRQLRPQVARVLEVLVGRPGELVTKDELVSQVWSDTFVTDDSLVQCISEIRKALGAEDSKLLRTVPKQGYRLDVRARRPAAHSGNLRVKVVATVVVIFALAVAAAAWWGARQAPAGGSQTIAIVPFENLGGDADQQYFSNGIADDLIVRLSRISDLRVVSRGAAFAVAGQFEDPRDIARELGAAYVLAGSVRRMGDTLRLTSVLVDGRTGENIWGKTSDGRVAEIFDFQESLVDDLARALSIRLSARERKRLGVRGTQSVEAFDWYLRGVELDNFLTPAANREAVAAFAKAIELDPNYAAAHAHMSLTLSMQAEYGWTREVDSTVADAVDYGEAALRLDPELPFAHFAMGRLKTRSFVGDKTGALAEFDMAIDLDPNYVDAMAFKAIALVSSGRAEDALKSIETALERNPRPPYWYFVSLGLSNYYIGDYEAAEAALRTVLERNPNLPNAYRILIATYGRLGDTDEAEWMAVEYEARGLSATVDDMMANLAVEDPAYRAAFEEGLRLAGLE